MPRPVKKIELPPEVERAIGDALVGLGRIGARAIASSVASVAKDVRRTVKKVNDRIAEVQGRAEHLAKGLEDNDGEDHGRK